MNVNVKKRRAKTQTKRTGFRRDGLVSRPVVHHVGAADELPLLVPDALRLVHVDPIDRRLLVASCTCDKSKKQARSSRHAGNAATAVWGRDGKDDAKQKRNNKRKQKGQQKQGT